MGTSMAGAAAGLGATAAAATGVGAIAAVLAWGIAQQGWFRGGEEALHVNPARDEFFAQFARLDPQAGGSGFRGLAWLLHELGLQDELGARYGTVDQPVAADRLHAALRAADTRAAFQAATDAIQSYIGQRRLRAIGLADYALAHFGGA
jgi:hypothetical protein